MEGGRAKNPVLFFFTYVHPGLKIFFFVNSYLLVMAYKGLVSIFLYLSPFWRNSTLLLSPISRGHFENLLHWNLSILPLLLEKHCFLWKSRLVASRPYNVGWDSYCRNCSGGGGGGGGGRAGGGGGCKSCKSIILAKLWSSKRWYLSMRLVWN